MLMLAFACEGIYDEARPLGDDGAAGDPQRLQHAGRMAAQRASRRGADLLRLYDELTGPVPGYFVITSQTAARQAR